MDLVFSEVKFFNPGVIKTRIPVRIFAELTNDLQKQVDAHPKKNNGALAGHIETELTYNLGESFKECVNQTFLEYRKTFNFYPDNDYLIDHSSWVNFQKKHEFQVFGHDT